MSVRYGEKRTSKKFDRIVPSPLPFHYYLASHDIMIMRGTDVLTAAGELLFNEKHRMIIAARKLELTMPRKKAAGFDVWKWKTFACKYESARVRV